MLLKKIRRFWEIFLATAITKAAGGFLMQNFDILVEYYLLNKTCKFIWGYRRKFFCKFELKLKKSEAQQIL
jgi:hypothetical protein